MLKKLFKALIDTLKDPRLLSSRPHHNKTTFTEDPHCPNCGKYFLHHNINGHHHKEAIDLFYDDKDFERDEDGSHLGDCCFITKEPLTSYPIWFCHEFDCFISEEGYKKVMEHEYCPEHESACEWCIIKGEFSQHVDVLA